MQSVFREFFREKQFFWYEIEHMNRCSERKKLELTKSKLKDADVSLCIMFF